MWRYVLQTCSYLLWFPLIVLTIQSVRRVGVRRYPLIFTYLTASFLIAVMQIPAGLAYRADPGQFEWLNFMYAAGDGGATVLLLAVVVSLIYRASEGLPAWRLVRTGVIAGSIVFIGVSFLIHYSSSRAALSFWIMPWKRDLNLCAAILNFALWTILLASRGRNPLLLVLTGGMGIMFAGDAIGDAIHHLAIRESSYWLFMTGNVVTTLADSAFLYVWWRTFREEKRKEGMVAAHSVR